MKFANVRTVKTKFSDFLNSDDPVVITRRGVPVAILYPVTEEKLEQLLSLLDSIKDKT